MKSKDGHYCHSTRAINSWSVKGKWLTVIKRIFPITKKKTLCFFITRSHQKREVIKSSQSGSCTPSFACCSQSLFVTFLLAAVFRDFIDVVNAKRWKSDGTCVFSYSVYDDYPSPEETWEFAAPANIRANNWFMMTLITAIWLLRAKFHWSIWMGSWLIFFFQIFYLLLFFVDEISIRLHHRFHHYFHSYGIWRIIPNSRKKKQQKSQSSRKTLLVPARMHFPIL